MVAPGSSLFLILIRYINAGHTTLSPLFFFSYILVALTQVSLSIVMCCTPQFSLYYIGGHFINSD